MFRFQNLVIPALRSWIVPTLVVPKFLQKLNFVLDKKFLILPVFFILSIIGILNHEIWLDEAQHYLLARDSNNFSQLLYACRNEGHPLLWNFILFVVTRFSHNVFYMQLTHILISCFTVILISKSNLNFPEKILIVFGYYFLYEYNIIGRNYGLSALFIFLLVYKYMSDRDNIIVLAVITFLLANSHLFSLLLSFAFVFTYFINNRKDLAAQSKISIIISIFILLAGWIFSIYCIVPPQNYGITFVRYDSTGYFSSERILKTISVCLKGIFYVPDYTAKGNHFENSLYYISLNLRSWIIYLLSIIAIILPMYILKNNKFAFTFFCSFILIFLPVYYFLPLVNGIRYFGFFYLIFIACYIIARPQIPKIFLRISMLIFLLQFINSVFMYSADFRYQFSEGKNISDYLKNIKKESEDVFILDRIIRPSISAYTERKYFGVENGLPLSYCLWNEYLPDSILKSKLKDELAKCSGALIVSTNASLHLIDTTKMVRLKFFGNGIVKGENAAVFRYIK